jgi:hypothetical protein
MAHTPPAVHPQAAIAAEGIVRATMIQDTTMAEFLVQDTIQLLPLLGRVMIVDLIRVMIRGTRLAPLHHRIMDMDEVGRRQDLTGDRL